MTNFHPFKYHFSSPLRNEEGNTEMAKAEAEEKLVDGYVNPKPCSSYIYFLFIIYNLYFFSSDCYFHMFLQY
jgi:hypothetical protein